MTETLGDGSKEWHFWKSGDETGAASTWYTDSVVFSGDGYTYDVPMDISAEAFSGRIR